MERVSMHEREAARRVIQRERQNEGREARRENFDQ
jgi:hypothetical protein